MKWIALFSQTGSEILEISKKRNRFPDKVITNSQNWDNINPDLVKSTSIYYVDKKPTVEQYLEFLPEGALVTMHGWLRIIPSEVCGKRNIINGHPGDIVTYPELKGKDPQERAWKLNHEWAGCVIHEAVAEVDAGEILRAQQVKIKGMSLDKVYKKLHDLSVIMWVEYLEDGKNGKVN